MVVGKEGGGSGGGDGIFGEINGGDGHGGDAFLAADEPEGFVGGGLDADAGGEDAEGVGDVLFHGGDVGLDLWAFGDEGGVDVDDAPATELDATGGLDEEDATGGVAPGGIVIGKQVADVDLADRTEDGIGDGMEEGIGIGMAIEPMGMGDGDTTEYEGTTGDQSMDIITDADVNHALERGLVGVGMEGLKGPD